jgi:hypothetical protein
MKTELLSAVRCGEMGYLRDIADYSDFDGGVPGGMSWPDTW